MNNTLSGSRQELVSGSDNNPSDVEASTPQAGRRRRSDRTRNSATSRDGGPGLTPQGSPRVRPRNFQDSTWSRPRQSQEQSLITVPERDPNEPAGYPTGPFCHPDRTLHRYIALVFMCFLGFGSYFCYDTPGALEDRIMQDMRVTTGSYASLYSLYSWPNVILCFFGGFLIDRVLGIRWGAIVFSLFILAGQVVFALGALFNWFPLMQIGRFIFGIGGESLAVAQNTYAVKWFKNKELNMVFGLQLSFARVGSTVNFNTMVPIYWSVKSTLVSMYGTAPGYAVLGWSLMIAAVTCIFSQICAFVLLYFDRRRDAYLKDKVELVARNGAAAAAEQGDADLPALTDAAPSESEKVRLSDVKDFSLSFWMLTLICVTYYCAIFPFIGLGGPFFKRKYEISAAESNAVDSITYVISAVLSPFLGILVDRTGRNITWVFAATALTLFAHAMLAFTFLNPWFPVVLMGIGYSTLACALWPMVALVIPEHQLGTAYGIMQSVQNLGLAVVSQIAGIIVDFKGFIVLEVFFLLWMCLALISTVILYVSDSARSHGHLNMSVKARLRYNQIISRRKERSSERRKVKSHDSHDGDSQERPLNLNINDDNGDGADSTIRNRNATRPA